MLSRIFKLASIGGIAVVLAGCNAYPVATNVSDASAYKTAATAKYRPADQLRIMDCMFDGLVASQTWGFPTIVRQTKRANGWRLDVTWLVNQYLVVDLTDDGNYKLDLWTDKAQIPLSKELAALDSCVQKFAAPAQ